MKLALRILKQNKNDQKQEAKIFKKRIYNKFLMKRVFMNWMKK